MSVTQTKDGKWLVNIHRKGFKRVRRTFLTEKAADQFERGYLSLDNSPPSLAESVKRAERASKKEISKRDEKETARRLWMKGFRPQEIKDYGQLKSSLRAIQQWQDEWKREDYCPEQIIHVADERLGELIRAKGKTKLDIQEMAILAQLIQTADTNRKALQAKTINKPARSENNTDNASDTTTRTKDGKKKKVINSIDHITDDMFEAFEKTLFWHQKISVDAAFDESLNLIRMILKPRQHGQTYVEAYIAFKRAVKFGQPHNFLSATLPQAFMFKAYINKIASEFFDCDPFVGAKKIVLKKDGKEWGGFEFISARVASAQSRPGHVIFDECAWMTRFAEVDEVANAMATQTGYTVTYLTTPSTVLHDFYEYWNGERVNKFRAPHEKINIDIRHSAFEKLDGYRLDGDGVARFLYTVDRAIEMGFTLVSLDKLRIKTPNPTVFDNIYRCQFIDDTSGVFSIKSLLRCLIADDDWMPYTKPKRVGCGYDPSSGSESSGDEAAIGYFELPDTITDPFRLLECSNFDSGTAKTHVDNFKERKKIYNVKNFFTDVSGSGIYVWQHVKNEVHNATRVDYTLQNKTEMVLKMQDLVREKRFLYHEDYKHEVIASFMSVKKGFTASTKQITYYSSRSKSVNGGSKHGELFWTAAMVCSGVEGLNQGEDSQEIQFYRA
jgi:Terminase large subunit, T4likevirus-type, N-terminal